MFKLFEEIVSNTTWKDANELKANLKKVCERLLERDRLNFVVRNSSERMLKIFKKKCFDLKIELKESQGISTIQSLRHLTRKKISSVKDDAALDMKSSGTSFEDNPFDVSDADFDIANATQIPLGRRTTMAPSTARGHASMRISMVNMKQS